MSNQEMNAYAMTIGGVLHQGTDDAADLVRARQLLNERDEAHLAQFGHLPGGEPRCTLPGYDRALTGAVAGVRTERRGATLDAGSTAAAAGELNRRAPWLNVSVGEDPVMVKARTELAQKVAALRANG